MDWWNYMNCVEFMAEAIWTHTTDTLYINSIPSTVYKFDTVVSDKPKKHTWLVVISCAD